MRFEVSDVIVPVFIDGCVVGSEEPEAEAPLVRVSQGRDLPSAVVAAQRDDPGLLRNRPPFARLGPEQDRRRAVL